VQTDLSAFPLSEEFQKEELELLNWLGLWLWLANEEDQAKQKSREGWLQLGDRNSHFFYAATKARTSRNSIRHLITETGALMSDTEAIKALATAYYDELYNQNLVYLSQASCQKKAY